MILANLFARRACCLLAGLLPVCLATGAIEAAGSADEARAINRQVLDLYGKKQFEDARVLAERGLALCDDAADVKVFCASQFVELLGDIATSQQEHAKALTYYQQALQLRGAPPAMDDRVIGKTQLRIGLAQ